jgi:hypothetical protein
MKNAEMGMKGVLFGAAAAIGFSGVGCSADPDVGDPEEVAVTTAAVKKEVLSEEPEGSEEGPDVGIEQAPSPPSPPNARIIAECNSQFGQECRVPGDTAPAEWQQCVARSGGACGGQANTECIGAADRSACQIREMALCQEDFVNRNCLEFITTNGFCWLQLQECLADNL